MRSALSILFLAVLAASAQASELKLVRVWPQTYESDAFQSLYEDRTGREISGKWTVMRTHAEDRGGLYFLTRVENPGAPLSAVTFTIRVIAPDSTDTKVYTFTAPVPTGSRLFELGLTGKDWAGVRVNPVAWAVELRGPDGVLSASAHSFLWERPGHPAAESSP